MKTTGDVDGVTRTGAGVGGVEQRPRITHHASRTPLSHPLHLYIHIPWCPTRCIYCDFNTYVDGSETLRARYQAALTREIAESGAALGRPALATIFIGGGTPTTLAADELVALVDTTRAAFDLAADAEITSEANPGTISEAYLRRLRAGGINRLSMGVQSLLDEELVFLGRRHDAATARRAVGMARRAGFENLSLDLIYNLPYQTMEGWRRTLDGAIALEPDHLSLYALMIEPGTPLQREIARGRVPVPDEGLGAEMFALARARLAAAGYAQYELSNWARDGGEPNHESPRRASIHNLGYWRDHPYLGLGAGAHSAHGGERWANRRRPQDYVEQVMGGAGLGLARDPRTVEAITARDALDAYMMLGLRLTREGISARAFERRFGVALAARFPDAIARGIAAGHLEWAGPSGDLRLRLTPGARIVADRVVVGFVGVISPD